MNLRNHARNKPCQVRLPGICSHNVAETRLAHVRMAGVTGGGMKAPDVLGAWACHPCSLATENGYEADTETKLAFLQGVIRTQARLVEFGILKW